MFVYVLHSPFLNYLYIYIYIVTIIFLPIFASKHISKKLIESTLTQYHHLTLRDVHFRSTNTTFSVYKLIYKQTEHSVYIHTMVWQLSLYPCSSQSNLSFSISMWKWKLRWTIYIPFTSFTNNLSYLNSMFSWHIYERLCDFALIIYGFY